MKSGDSGFDNIVATQVKGQGMWENLDVAEGAFKYAIYENDFIRYPDYDATNEWELNAVGAGSVALSNDVDFGILVLTTAAADNDYEQIQFSQANAAGEWISLAANKALFFEVRIALEDADVGDAFVGLCITDTDIHDTGTGIPEASDYIGFAKDDGDAYWDFVSRMNTGVGNETEQAAIATATDGTYVTLSFYVDGTSKAQCWIDGVKGPPITTNLPTDEQLCLTFIIQAGSGGAEVLSIDFVRAYRER